MFITELVSQMIKLSNTYGLVLALAISIGCSSKKEITGSLRITGVNIIDVVGDGVSKSPMDIIIEDQRIKAIEESGSYAVNDNIETFEANGKYVIPGLWDMHAHPDDPEIWRMNPKDEEKDRLLTLLVLHGVTGIRDMAGDLQLAKRWKRMVLSGELIGPEIFAAGPLIDGPDPMWDGSVGINGPSNVRQVVDSLISEGVDFLKVYSLLPGDIYLELQRYANEIDFPVAGHVPYDIRPSEAAQAGIKSQEHFLEILKEVSTESDALRVDEIDYGNAKSRFEKYLFRNQLMLDTYSEDKIKMLFELMAKNNTWHTPTISMWHKNAWFESEIKEDTALYRYLPPYMRRYWQIGENDHLQNRDENLLKLKQDQVEVYSKLLFKMYLAGVPLLTGTDMGANPLCFPGIGVHNELEMFVKAGIPEIDALKAATINPSIFLEIDNEFGSIENGKIADMVILNQNPLDDINAVRDIASVIKRGEMYDKGSIREILKSIEQEFKQ